MRLQLLFPNACALSQSSYLAAAFSVAVLIRLLFLFIHLIGGLRVFDETRVHKLLNSSLPIHTIASGAGSGRFLLSDYFISLSPSADERTSIGLYVSKILFSLDRSTPSTSASLCESIIIIISSAEPRNLENTNRKWNKYEFQSNEHGTVSDEIHHYIRISHLQRQLHH